jgi:nitroimidazol reductase NimA-like FMN-containing flavoprotein (pyridoxamine 5'-phosphate oxidase superfamily)
MSEREDPPPSGGPPEDPPLSKTPAKDPPDETPAKKFTSRFGISREMTDEETEDLLTRSWWGSLATVEEAGPYSVPVIYGWDKENFYVASRSGRKITNLRENPAVCLTVVEAEGLGELWYSVVVLGDAELVHGFQGHVTAIRALRGQVGRGGKIRPKDVAAMAAAKVIRISPREITGRIRIG